MKTVFACLILLTSTLVPAQEILIPVKDGGLWGYVDQYGHKVIDLDYFDAGSFSEGLAPVTEKK